MTIPPNSFQKFVVNEDQRFYVGVDFAKLINNIKMNDSISFTYRDDDESHVIVNIKTSRPEDFSEEIEMPVSKITDAADRDLKPLPPAEDFRPAKSIPIPSLKNLSGCVIIRQYEEYMEIDNTKGSKITFGTAPSNFNRRRLKYHFDSKTIEDLSYYEENFDVSLIKILNVFNKLTPQASFYTPLGDYPSRLPIKIHCNLISNRWFMGELVMIIRPQI